MIPDEIAFDSRVVALKVIASGTGSITAPYTESMDSNTVTIPHGQNSTDVIPSVIASAPLYESVTYFSLPYASADGRIALDVRIDSTNMYLIATSQTGGLPQDAVDFTYFYTILIP